MLALVALLILAHQERMPPVPGPEPTAGDEDIWGTGEPYVGSGDQPLPQTITPQRWLVRRRWSSDDAWTCAAKFILDPIAVPVIDGDWRSFSGSEPTHGLCAYTLVEVEHAQIRMARLAGAQTLFVNGEAFVGDAEHFGFQGVPVALQAGRNHILVVGASDMFRLDMWWPSTRMVIGTWDIEWPYADPWGS